MSSTNVALIGLYMFSVSITPWNSWFTLATTWHFFLQIFFIPVYLENQLYFTSTEDLKVFSSSIQFLRGMQVSFGRCPLFYLCLPSAFMLCPVTQFLSTFRLLENRIFLYFTSFFVPPREGLSRHISEVQSYNPNDIYLSPPSHRASYAIHNSFL